MSTDLGQKLQHKEEEINQQDAKKNRDRNVATTEVSALVKSKIQKANETINTAGYPRSGSTSIYTSISACLIPVVVLSLSRIDWM